MYRITALMSVLMLLAALACKQSAREEAASRPDYAALGDSLTRMTFDTLRNTLQRSMADSGVVAAIRICRSEAMGLTGTYADGEVSIRRTALRYRNPENEPDSLETAQLMAWEAAEAAGDSLKPALIDAGSMVHYFKPILLQPMCLSCHGEAGRDIGEATLQAIRQYYPNDRATGFAAGQLRGMWHVTFARQSNSSIP